ncbi:MAG: hypothetical protein WBG39_07080 [Gordonia sp. (in: high G+C Gram-positive bacteria)]
MIRTSMVVAAVAVLIASVAACDPVPPRAGPSSAVASVTETVPDTDMSPVTVTRTVSQTTAPQHNNPTASQPTPSATDLSRYYGQWDGHGRGMTLNPDGSATVSLASGAANVEKWTATWGAHGHGIVVTLQTMTSRTGEPLGQEPGESWTGSLEPSPEDGVTILHMPGFTDWCSTKYGRSVACGA